MHMKNELKQRRTQPHFSLFNETLDGEELKDWTGWSKRNLISMLQIII